jgi:hypothetical protein
MNGQPLLVSTLLGRAQVETALACLGSLRRYGAEPFRLRIHDDGTLGPGELARLEGALGSFEVVPRREADERMEEILARHPAARACRGANPLALKLLDAPLLTGGERLAFCDGDILFLRPFSGLFAWPGPDVGAVMMADTQDAYSVRSWHLLLDRRLRLPRRINTGVVLFRTELYDLDLVDWFLARPGYQRTPVWVEQTAWALLAARAGCQVYDPRQIAFPERPVRIPGEAMALHFVSPRRDLLPAYQEAAPDRTGEPPVAVRTLPARRCGWAAMAGSEGLRLLARWV